MDEIIRTELIELSDDELDVVSAGQETPTTINQNHQFDHTFQFTQAFQAFFAGFEIETA